MARHRSQDELFQHTYDGIQEFDNDLPGWWKWLFYLTIAFAIGYLLYYHVLGIGDSSRVEYLKEMNPAYVPGPMESGGFISSYHSPFLSRDENLTPRVRSELAKIVDASFEDNLMRAMAKADPAQLAQLRTDFPAVYRRFAAGGTPAGGSATAAAEPTIAAPLKDAAALAEGQRIFESICFTCHGKHGEGLIGPNLTDDYWLHGGSIANVITTIRKGVPAKGMISWEKTLAPKQIDAVASYILVKLQGSNPPNPKPPQGEKMTQ
jgi:mono/diheme cytochrome c family protein